jgi:hypothetical protein
MRRNERHELEDKLAGYEYEDGRRGRDFALLIAGIGIGAGAALLLAPSSGEDARHAISRNYRKTVKRIARHTENLLDRTENILEHAQHLQRRGSRLFHFGRGEHGIRRSA